jgi:hypothetical protein
VKLSNEMFHLIAVVVAASILLHSSTDVVVTRQFRFKRRVGDGPAERTGKPWTRYWLGGEPLASFPPPATAVEAPRDESFAHTRHLLTISEPVASHYRWSRAIELFDRGWDRRRRLTPHVECSGLRELRGEAFGRT